MYYYFNYYCDISYLGFSLELFWNWQTISVQFARVGNL